MLKDEKGLFFMTCLKNKSWNSLTLNKWFNSKSLMRFHVFLKFYKVIMMQQLMQPFDNNFL